MVQYLSYLSVVQHNIISFRSFFVCNWPKQTAKRRGIIHHLLAQFLLNGSLVAHAASDSLS